MSNIHSEKIGLSRLAENVDDHEARKTIRTLRAIFAFMGQTDPFDAGTINQTFLKMLDQHYKVYLETTVLPERSPLAVLNSTFFNFLQSVIVSNEALINGDRYSIPRSGTERNEHAFRPNFAEYGGYFAKPNNRVLTDQEARQKVVLIDKELYKAIQKSNLRATVIIVEGEKSGYIDVALLAKQGRVYVENTLRNFMHVNNLNAFFTRLDQEIAKKQG